VSMRDQMSYRTSERVNDSPLTRVFLLAGVRLYREGLAHFLRSHDQIELVGAAGDIDIGLEQIARVAPDVVLLDRLLSDGVGLVRRILSMRPQPYVVALAVSEMETDILPYAHAGVSGYVMHDDSLDALACKTLAVARGEAVCSPRTTATLLRALGRRDEGPEIRLNHGLTRREVEILMLLDQGLSNKEIAADLVIELPTVKNHVHHIYEKLEVADRAAAIAWLRAQRRAAEAVVGGHPAYPGAAI
jgi:two-component system, NarL family, nitrate/nitrite response regulator NarL